MKGFRAENDEIVLVRVWSGHISPFSPDQMSRCGRRHIRAAPAIKGCGRCGGSGLVFKVWWPDSVPGKWHIVATVLHSSLIKGCKLIIIIHYHILPPPPPPTSLTPPPINNTRVLPHINKTDKTDVDGSRDPPQWMTSAVTGGIVCGLQLSCSRCCYGRGEQPGLGTPAAAV